MKLLDSRRLTGINVVSDSPGAVVDVAFEDADPEAVIAAWQGTARTALDAVGWGNERTAVRRFVGGASLQITAPIDGWYAACEVNEWAWQAAAAALEGAPAEDLEEVAPRLRELIAEEANPRLMALRDAAAEHRVTLLADDETASVGLGRGSIRWPVRELPDAGAVDWAAVHDIPVVLITGTNGKTTTARLLARMVAATGAVPGNTSSDGVQVGGETVLAGDYTGGEGARALLQDARVDTAILEAARGGLLRRGLPVARAEAALVTNVGADHLGEFGVADIEELADTKMLVARAVDAGGTVVLNADDAALAARAERVAAPITWIAYSRLSPVIERHVAAGGEALYMRDRQLVRCHDGRFEEILPVDEIPITFAGAARHNVYNALGAAALGFALGLDRDAVAGGLRALRGTVQDNPGRANLFEVEGARVLVDFAHNPPGIDAIVAMANRLPAERRLVVLGQAGDRDDEAIRGLARAAWRPGIDHVIVKEMPKYLRGREPGEVPAIIADELRRCGAPPGSVEITASELEAVQRAVAWSRPGDLLLLLLQERAEGVAWLQRAGTPGWATASESDPDGV
ncbi:MAG: Mur ligase family protein [Acidobacteriota bacterium]|jgi:UDP-N-acetylmuramyl tripeptide synthase